MSKCNHSITTFKTAEYAGMCPWCKTAKLEAKLAEIKDICESRLGSYHYTDAISDIHSIAIWSKYDE